jgi:gliding motility-associated-like protein
MPSFPLRVCLWLLAWLSSTAALAGSGLQFVPNHGQWPAAVRYRAALPGGTVFLTDRGLVYDWLSATDLDRGHTWCLERESTTARLHRNPDGPARPEPQLRGHAVFVDFEGAKAAPQLTASKPLTERHNYYLGNDPEHWATDVPVVGRVRYQELYPGIGLELYGTAQGQLEYDLHVAPGADAAAIRLRYRGAEALTLLPDGRLRVQTSVNDVHELPPVAWQELPTGRRAVPCRYTLRGSTVGFAFPRGYDRRYALVIDPEVLVSTFTGSRGIVYGVVSMPAPDGGIVSGGRALGTGLPTTPGAYQTAFRGVIDHVVCRFDSTGQRLQYATYLGGSDIDELNALNISPATGDLYVLGTSYSANFPTRNAYSSVLAGNCDLVVSRLSSAGVLAGSTYLGGSGIDEGADLAFAPSGDLYLLGTTNSANLPFAIRYDPTPNGRLDGLLAHMDLSLHGLWWTTYFGGSQNDVPAALRVERSSGDVLIVGSTLSANFPTTGGAAQRTFRAPGEGFVCRFEQNALQLKASTYWGAPDGEDELTGLHLAADGSLLLLGHSYGQMPATSRALNEPGGHVFVTDMEALLGAQRFTAVFGAAALFTPMTLAQDACGNILGAGFGSAGMTVRNPPGLVGQATTGNYLFAMRYDGSGLLAGWYYGNHDGHAHSPTQRFDNEGNLYQAVCGAAPTLAAIPSLPAPMYAAQPLSSHDMLTLKLSLPLGERVLQPRIGPAPTGCAPLTVAFDNQTVGGRRYRWNFGDGSAADTARQPTHVYTQPGTYRVSLGVQGQQGSCLQTDTARTTIVVRQPVPRQFPLQRLECATGNVLTLDATSAEASTYQWSTGETTPRITVTEPGTYVVQLGGPGGCRWQDTLRVELAPAVQVPNVITPNGDNKNDAFAPRNLPPGCRLAVYNRWGRQVYTSADYRGDWQADELPAGVYYYLLEGAALCEKRIKGWLEVVR